MIWTSIGLIAISLLGLAVAIWRHNYRYHRKLNYMLEKRDAFIKEAKEQQRLYPEGGYSPIKELRKSFYESRKKS